MLAKNLDNVTTQVPIQVLDIDKEEDLARHFNVRSVPTLVMINEDKKEVKRVVGVQSVKQLNQFINE
jgi:thioredoxin-like negative regulator of GroEL|tara:strand:- start:419 stop:619 length:201 start_codon:yes stop_codon:yes gene_type:complete